MMTFASFLVVMALTLPGKAPDRLVWSDEFEYTGKPDPAKWTYDLGFIANQEKQYYTDHLENARVENGCLVLEARRENIANKDHGNPDLMNTWAEYKATIDTARYTSARIKTEDLAEWQYGRIEVRAKLPAGRGMWPAIWMLSESRETVGWPECGEIDIMEHVGYDPDTIHGTIHTKAYNHMIGTQKGKTIFIEEPYDQFHVYSIEWTPEKIDFLLDGIVYNHIQNEHLTTAEWPFDQKFYLILNLAVGGSWGGAKGVDDSVFPARMLVDYVRVYQP
ncbi:MAG: glycoside hydrolase family 16 protein [Bacteroidales bacterium]